MKWLWALIPAPFKIWAIAGLVLAGLALVSLVVYKIDSRGYNRCKAEYAEAERKHQETARVEIVKSGKKYETIKKNVARLSGVDNPAGDRVTLAIDSLP